MADLYTGDINEFVDWVSGENSFTQQNVTGGQPVSGSSIRRLLQNKLKSPIYVEEDRTNNLYRIFSSRDAYALWLENPSDNADLQLFTIPRPSDYKLTLNITNNGDRYVKVGDDTNVLTKIQFNWRIYNDEGDSSDGLSVTYTIQNVESGSVSSFIRRYNKGVSEDFSIYQYLKVGENRITIEGQGNNTGARNSTSFNINLLDINVTCDFNFAGHHSKNESLRVPYTFYRNNVDGSAKIYFVVDNEITYTVDIPKGGNNTSTDTGKMISPSLEEGQHSLQVYAETVYNEGQITIYSNLLYFTFVIASSEIGIINKFINIATSFDNGNYPLSSLTLNTIQYYPSELRWGYYTDATSTDTSIPITWKLLEENNATILSTINASTGYEASVLNYIATIHTDLEQLYLGAYFNQEELIKIPIYITQNQDLQNIYETDNYELKMTAYGKTNDSSDRDIWKDTTNTISTEFHNIQWTPNSGWYKNSFKTQGTNQYAIINFQPFKSTSNNFPFDYGKTIEIEFESEKVSNQDDKLIVAGSEGGARIEITPNTATLYDSFNNDVIHTNYKANERIKITFIINKVSSPTTVDDGLIYIINNGILERGAVATGTSFTSNGTIKIGGSESGVRLYNLRVYDKSISYMDAYNNFIYDSDNKTELVNRNQILSQGSISYDLCKNKIDTILITGNLSTILNQNSDKEDSTTDVMIERVCPYDASKDFIVGEVIDDPDIPNQQKVVNGAMIRKHGQSTLNYPISSMKIWLNKSKSGTTPIFQKNPQANLLLNKNRYKMKNTSIPANKFVLQANYADSSGVHNGGLLRLIQSSWYNAKVNGKYVLRTEPQLFSSIKSSEKDAYGLTRVWKDDFPNVDFPYQIEISADSFPCAVFYYDLNGTKTTTFLGQYVFMEDKKSDFNYGERSIYKISNDPFCMTVTHKDDDVTTNRIWDNSNVLRMEVLEVNNKYSSYTTTEDLEARIGNTYSWEQAFELIYPDPDDIEKDDTEKGLTKFDSNSKYVKTVKPFLDWYKWLVSTKGNHQKFQDEASLHLDLYKLAAYYIFVLRFALVDSLERNAQIKTYDGQHFHYEPWDMDIALGNKNDGGIAFNPPIDRNTKLNINTYAISGRASNEQGEIISSNWLWDALEAWPEWSNTIVPQVADALYNAGLTYDNISEMFDENYANKWCEIIYNESGHFKYVESIGGDYTRWLTWLQGARMSHRHWWLSTSMDYYDAKWFCGDYKNHRIYLAANIEADENKAIRITPNGSTYMIVTVNYQEDAQESGEQVTDNREVSQNNPLIYRMSRGASTKAPIHIYGANFMEVIDMSDIALGIDALDLTGTYSQVLGAPLRILDVGTPLTEIDNDTYTTVLSPSTCGISPVIRERNINAFENLETLNIRGHQHLGNVQQYSFGINQWTRELNLTQLKNFYAMGSGLNNFYSSDSGNKFNVVELPSSVNIINMKNSSWDELSFWETTEENNLATITRYSKTVNNVVLSVPPDIRELRLLGSTGKTRESLLFVREWLQSIVDEYGESALSNYTLEMDNIYWNTENIGENFLLTFEELRLIALTNHQLRGYLLLKYEGLNTELTATQLTEIRNWFGDTVFTKGSSGLVVDYSHNYVQINVGGQVVIDNNEVYITEGNKAVLSATKFLLQEATNQNYIWGISQHGAQGSVARYRGASIIASSDTVDGNTYLQTRESPEGYNYDIDVKVAISGQLYVTPVHVIAATYPDSFKLQSTTIGSIHPRISNNIITLWQTGCSSKLSLFTEDSYTATISSIQYIISNQQNQSCTYSTVTGKSWNGEIFNLDEHLQISLPTVEDQSIIVYASNVPNDNTIYEYTVTTKVTFKSDKQMIITNKIIVMNDSSYIVTPQQEVLYNAISQVWSTYFDTVPEAYYRTDLMQLEGRLTFNNIDNLIAYSGEDSVLSYLPKVTGLTFTNCQNLTSTYTYNNRSINQLVFNDMFELEYLNIQNCSSLTEDIDLTNCSKIKQVFASGTYVNILIPEDCAITHYSIGTPTSVTLIRPTVLTNDNIVIGSSNNITDIDIENMASVSGFKTFTKLMKIT